MIKLKTFCEPIAGVFFAASGCQRSNREFKKGDLTSPFSIQDSVEP
jgi:hypothetical protein